MERLLQDSYDWVQDYIKGFYTEQADVQPMILVKEEHTKYVVGICKELANVLGFSRNDAILAELIGLFHDIGRFKQYTIYKTFNDKISVDHSLLGLQEIEQLPLLRQLSPEDLSVFRFAIKNHNAMVIAPTEDQRQLLFAKLIRDADKLDIYRVLSPTLKPSDGSGYNKEFAKLFVAGKQCDYTLIKSHDDQKLVRLLWMYDIYFPWTMQKIIERGYADQIIGFLPQNETTMEGVARLKEHMEKLANQE